MNRTVLYLFLILHFFAGATIYAQDRSNNQIQERSQKELITAKIDSAKLIFVAEPIKAFEYVETAIALALNEGFRNELALGYATLSEFNYRMAEYTSSVSYAGKALEIYTTSQQWDKAIPAYILRGDANIQLGAYQRARLNFEQALALAETAKKQDQVLRIQFKLADLKMMENESVEAERLFNELKKEVGALNMIELVAEIDFKLGEIYAQRGDFQQANLFYDHSNMNAFQSNNADLINLNNSKLLENNYTSFTSPTFSQDMLHSLNSAEVVFQVANDTAAWITNTSQKADYYLKTGQIKAAEDALRQNYQLAKEKGDLAAQLKASKQLYDLYVQAGRKSEAKLAEENNARLLNEINLKQIEEGSQSNQNQLAIKNVAKQIENLERARDLDQQTILLLEKEKNLNKDELAQQRLLLYVLGGIVIIFGGVSIYVYRNIQAKKRAHNLLYLKSLRAQMNPHFIFNSLNSVNNYIAKSDARAANKYLAKFSKLMRQVLEHSQVEFISLGQEIEVLKIYLELEHERFKDQFDYRFEVDSSIALDSVQIPPMLVQPFIENAIWHGLRYRENGGLLEVLIQKEGRHIRIIIRDNGIGRKKSLELKTVNQLKQQSTGMKNVASRTEVIQAVFKASIRHEIIDLPEDSGTEVRIKIEWDENN